MFYVPLDTLCLTHTTSLTLTLEAVFPNLRGNNPPMLNLTVILKLLIACPKFGAHIAIDAVLNPINQKTWP